MKVYNILKLFSILIMSSLFVEINANIRLETTLIQAWQSGDEDIVEMNCNDERKYVISFDRNRDKYYITFQYFKDGIIADERKYETTDWKISTIRENLNQSKITMTIGDNLNYEILWNENKGVGMVSESIFNNGECKMMINYFGIVEYYLPDCLTLNVYDGKTFDSRRGNSTTSIEKIGLPNQIVIGEPLNVISIKDKGGNITTAYSYNLVEAYNDAHNNTYNVIYHTESDTYFALIYQKDSGHTVFEIVELDKNVAGSIHGRKPISGVSYECVIDNF